MLDTGGLTGGLLAGGFAGGPPLGGFAGGFTGGLFGSWGLVIPVGVTAGGTGFAGVPLAGCPMKLVEVIVPKNGPLVVGTVCTY